MTHRLSVSVEHTHARTSNIPMYDMISNRLTSIQWGALSIDRNTAIFIPIENYTSTRIVLSLKFLNPIFRQTEVKANPPINVWCNKFMNPRFSESVLFGIVALTENDIYYKYYQFLSPFSYWVVYAWSNRCRVCFHV